MAFGLPGWGMNSSFFFAVPSHEDAASVLFLSKMRVPVLFCAGFV